MALKTKWLLTKSKSCSCTLVGVYRALVCCPGVVVIFHGPIGCVHVASTMDLGASFRVMADGGKENCGTIPLVSSHLREKDGIFGGIDRLSDCISYVMDTYHPKCVWIVSSCVAGIIGDDIEQEAKAAEASYGIPVIPMPFAGFLGGEYSDGYYQTTEMMIRRFFRKQKRVKGRVLLLGDQMGPEGQYVREIKRLLSRFGLTVKWQFPGHVPFEEWKDIPSADFSILLGTVGQRGGMMKIAQLLEDTYGVRTLGDVYPVGWNPTKNWIRALADLLHEKEQGEATIKEEEARIERAASSFLPVTEGKMAVIGIGRGPRWYHPKETLARIARLHLACAGIVFFDNLTEDDKKILREEIAAAGDIPIYNSQDGQAVMDACDILLTTNEIYNTKARQLFIPMVPLTGTEGEIAELRAMYRLLCRYGKKGGVAYVTV